MARLTWFYIWTLGGVIVLPSVLTVMTKPSARTRRFVAGLMVAIVIGSAPMVSLQRIAYLICYDTWLSWLYANCW